MRRDILRPVIWGALAVALALATSTGVLMQYARSPSDIPHSVTLSDALTKANEQIREREQRLRALDERLREDVARFQREIEANRLAANGFPKSIDLYTSTMNDGLARLQERLEKLTAMATAGEPYLPPKPPAPPLSENPVRGGQEEEEVQPQLADTENTDNPAPLGSSSSPEQAIDLSMPYSFICCSLFSDEDTAKELRTRLERDIGTLKDRQRYLIEMSESMARFEGQALALEAARAQLVATLATVASLPSRGSPIVDPGSEEKWIPLWLAALTVLGSVLIAALGAGIGTWATMRVRP